MPAEPTCVFCRIVAGSADASFVHEGPDVVAFMDIHPVTRGHLLVVPREHLPALADVPPRIGAEMFTIAQRLAAVLRATEITTEGINLFYADGAAAFQTVFHAHLHVIPRYRSDGFRISRDHWGFMPDRSDLDADAEAILGALHARPALAPRRPCDRLRQTCTISKACSATASPATCSSTRWVPR